jgi:ribosomal-protein-alanine N-acetyltransferase
MHMLNHMGTKKLETKRLILRRFTEEDALDMYNNWASDPEVTKFITWPTHSSLDVTKRVIGMWTSSYDNLEYYHWVIELKEKRSAIGSISLMNIDNNIDGCEVGYCIGRAFWNKGIVTEALNAVIDFAFKEVGFERITARHHVGNDASGRVMEKCGLKYEGTLRKISRNGQGQLVDCKYFSILKDEYLG